MFGFNDITIEFLSDHPVLITLALVILLGLTGLLYYRTNPPLPRWLQVVLWSLRSVAVLLIVAALLEPVIAYSFGRERLRRVSVLVDHSLSMEHEDEGVTRAARVDSLLGSPAFDALAGGADVSLWYFGDSLAKSPDAIGRDRSALGEALADLERHELANPADYWLLLSDGNSNSGRRPTEVVQGVHTPITCIGMAQGGGGFDIALSDIEYNSVAFVGQPTEIKATLALHRAAGQTVRVQLVEGNRTLAEQSLAVSEEGGFGEVTLKLIPETPGQHLIRVQAPKLEGEETEDNNGRTIAIKALKSRLKILLVSDHPDYEVGFLNRLLRQSDRYDVTFKATGGEAGNLTGRLPTVQAELNQYDLVVIHDPKPSALRPYRDVLRSYLRERGGGLWAMYGPQFAEAGSEPWFDSLMPMSIPNPLPPRYRDFHMVPAEGQLFHPALRLADDRAAIRDYWASLPPLRILVPCERLQPHAMALAFASGVGLPEGRYLTLAQQRLGPGKVVASAALPFWAWGFKPLAFQADNSGYRRFIEGLVSWLTIQDDFDPIRIAPEKEVFSRGEAVRFDAFAFDQGFRPIDDVSGSVTLKAEDSRSFEQALTAIGEGAHKAEFPNLPPGRYEYEAVLEKDGALLKRQTGRLLVETFSLEEFDQQGNSAALQAIARASGGSFATYPQFGEAVAALDLAPVLETVTGEYVLWGKLWLLLAFIGLLTAEWLIRKSQHLV